MNQQLIGGSWYQVLEEEFKKPYFELLKAKLRQEYNNYKVYPSPHDIFKAFLLCPFENVRVVMIGQDPYPFGQADGMAFSTYVKDTPYSLQMIFRELDRDLIRTKNYQEYKRSFPTNDLSSWAKGGVLLLNPVLTVRANETGSHRGMGWMTFTDTVLRLLALDTKPKVFVALGKDAETSVDRMLMSIGEAFPHTILRVGHPASGAHGKDKYSGCSMFSKINRYFKLKGLPEIDWRLDGIR